MVVFNQYNIFDYRFYSYHNNTQPAAVLQKNPDK